MGSGRSNGFVAGQLHFKNEENTLWRDADFAMRNSL
jgi:hypothetical protein